MLHIVTHVMESEVKSFTIDVVIREYHVHKSAMGEQLLCYYDRYMQ